MKRISFCLLLGMVLALVAGCGKTAPAGNAAKAGNAVKADPAMLEQANSNIQTRYAQMAFDDTYMYFSSGDHVYRCGYDGSDVTAVFDRYLHNLVVADGKLWGNYTTGNPEEKTGLYCIDLATGAATLEVETSGTDDHVTSVLISGDWMVYVAKNGMELVVRNLSTGEEKTICTWSEEENTTEDIAMCLYGNTLYVQYYTDPSEYRYAVCTYELGSNADTLTELGTYSYSDSPRTLVWMEDGFLTASSPSSGEGELIFYLAKFSDIQDGKLSYRKEENQIGVALANSHDRSVYNMITDNYNTSRYVLGNNILFLGYSKVYYYKDFDLTNEQMLVELDGVNDKPNGVHNGSLYIFDYGWEAQFVKISEDGTVEYIPVTMPEE